MYYGYDIYAVVWLVLTKKIECMFYKSTRGKHQHQHAIRGSWRLGKFEGGERHHGLDCNQIYGIGGCENHWLCREKSPRRNIGHCNQCVSNPAKKFRKPCKRARSHTPNNGAQLKCVEKKRHDKKCICFIKYFYFWFFLYRDLWQRFKILAVFRHKF